jgi:hypothetical protein
MQTKSGRNVLKRRRQKGRKNLIAVEIGGNKRINWKEASNQPRRSK